MAPRAFLAMLLLSAGGPAGAITFVDVQFGASGYAGAAMVGSAEDYWNSEGAAGTSQALMDPSDQTTGLTLTWSTPRTWAGSNGFASTPYAGLMTGYLFNGYADPVTITLAGLTPNADFDLYVYSQGDSGSNGRTMQVDANGVIADTTTMNYTTSTFILGQNYLELAVASDGSGQIGISFNPTSEGNFEADLNGFQLLNAGPTVPEPSPLGLLAAGLAGLAYRKRHALPR